MSTTRLNPKSIYRIKTRKVPLAVGRPTFSGRFLVFANSCAALVPSEGHQTTPDSAGRAVRHRREALLSLGILVNDGEGHLVFTQDFAFQSCHDAAAIVMGLQAADGFREWKPLI